MSSALEMIALCFQHQHPEAFGRSPVGVPCIPTTMILGIVNDTVPTPEQEVFHPERECYGHPDAIAHDLIEEELGSAAGLGE